MAKTEYVGDKVSIDDIIKAKVLTIFNPDADAIVLGSATDEGGDIKIYRDASGNLGFSLDADAASNAKGADFYAGVVCQNYLTVGQTSLNTSYSFYNEGAAYLNGNTIINGYMLVTNGSIKTSNNVGTLNMNLPVISGSATHAVKLQIDSNDIIVAQAIGNGAGGAADLAIGFFGTAPQIQQAHIVDADGQLADITTKFNTLLADLEGYGLLLSA